MIFFSKKQLALCGFLFASKENLFKRSLLLKERICSKRSKFFLLKVDPSEKGGIKENARVDLEVSLKVIPIYLS